MLLESKDLCEFRIRRSYTSKNSGNVSYFYTFENDDLGSFELWCSNNFNLVKGQKYRLVFDMSSYGGDIRYSLKDVVGDQEI